MRSPIGGACPAWTPEEDRALRERWPVGGYAAVRELLPRRTYSAIVTRAAKLRVKAPRHICVRPKRFTVTDQIDRLIVEGYAKATSRDDIRRLAERLNRPRWWIGKRAAVLGVRPVRRREAPWSAAELELLESLAHHSLPVICRKLRAAGYPRTETAVGQKLKRENVSRRLARADAGVYSASALATLFGVDAKTVTRWIRDEGLPATKAGTARTDAQGGDEWRVKAKALRTWVGDNAGRIDLRKVHNVWFIDLMMGRAA